MRKVLTVIGLIIVFFVIYFLQVNTFTTFTIAGVKPNLFVIYVLFIGLFANQFVGISLGVLFGIILDLLYGKIIGVSAVMLCVIGYLGSYFDKNFSKENKITIILMVIGATVLHELGLYFISTIVMNFDAEYGLFFKILALEIVYHVLLVIILYPLTQKIGYWIDRNFKKTNILTRYF